MSLILSDELEVLAADAAHREEDRHRRHDHNPRSDGPPNPPPKGHDDQETGDQRSKPGDREAERQRGEQDAGNDRGGDREPRVPRPCQVRAQRHQHERQRPPQDVRVVEERVDAEVEMQLVGGEQVPLAEEEVASRVLPERDPGEDKRDRGDRDQDPAQQPIAPADLTEHHEQQRKGNEEEGGVLDRVRDVDRIRALDRVEHQRGGQHSVQPNDRGRVSQGGWVRRRRVVAPLAAATQRRVPEAEHAAGDHDVERHEEVGGLAANVHRDSERKDRKCGNREAPGEAAEDRRDDRRARDGHDDDHSQLFGRMAQCDQAGAVPDVPGDQHRGRH